MPYKNPTRQRLFQKRWIADRRAAWLKANGPCACGSWDRLQVDHKDASKKVSHRVWSWSENKRLAELAKCQVLCHECHKRKTEENLEGAYKASAETVAAIRAEYAGGLGSVRFLAARHDLKKTQVHRIIQGVSRVGVS